jgi:hypothetical protein
MDVLQFVSQPGQLAVSGMSVRELQGKVPQGKIAQASYDVQVDQSDCCCCVLNDEHEFKRLCQTFNNIHWLHRVGNSFVWRGSKGDVTLLRNHVLDGTLYSDVETVMELPHQVVLLISEPGMGKSTELSDLASVIKLADPNTCVMRINRNNHIDYLKEVSPVLLSCSVELVGLTYNSRNISFNTNYTR